MNVITFINIIITRAKELTPIIAIISIFIQIAPIQINPWTWFFSLIGKMMNKDLYNRIEKLQEDIVTIRNRNDENEIDRLRYEILSFSNSCQNGRKHSKDEFVHIIKSNEKYHDILNRLDKTNGVLDLEFQNIQKIYQECLEKNSFL